MIPINFIIEMENIAPMRMKERFGIQYASTFLEKFVGLMFRKDFHGKMVFKFTRPCSFIVHTLFMKFGIHIQFFNNKKLVKECNMKPWHFMVVRDVDCFVERKI